MRNARKLITFVILIVFSLLFVTSSHATLLAEYSLERWNGYNDDLAVQGGSYNLYNLDAYILNAGGVVLVAPDPYPKYGAYGFSQQMAAETGVSLDWNSNSIYPTWARSELWLTTDKAETLTLSFKYSLNVSSVWDWREIPSPDPGIGVAQVYIKIGDTLYFQASDNANLEYLVNQIFSTDIKLNAGDKLIIGCYGFAGFENYAYVAGADALVQNIQVTPTPTPVPASFWLLGTGLLGLIGFRKVKKH